MSTDYLARLEQQRGPQPSESMLAALARGLRLTRDERDHLFRLAGHTPPARSRRTEHVSPALMRVLYRLDTPALVVTDLGAVRRRVARSAVSRPKRRARERPRRAAPTRQSRVRHGVGRASRRDQGKRAQAHRRPQVGLIEVDCQTLVAEEQGQALLVFTATPGTADHDKLQLLKVIGTQRFDSNPTPPASEHATNTRPPAG